MATGKAAAELAHKDAEAGTWVKLHKTQTHQLNLDKTQDAQLEVRATNADTKSYEVRARAFSQRRASSWQSLMKSIAT